MRVLIACEFSGTVRDAFSRRGHFARSCDLLNTESLPDPVRFRADYGCYDHAQYDPDCEECEYGEPWCHKHGMDAAECTCLGPTEDEAEYAESYERGARHLSGDLFSIEDVESYDLLIAHPPCTHLAVSGARHFAAKRADGRQQEAIDFFMRIARLPVPRICIENPVSIMSSVWRKPDQIIQPWQFGHGETKATCLWLKNLPPLKPTKIVPGRDARIHRMPPSPTRWKERSKTYAGIAEAMADQWPGDCDSGTLFEGQMLNRMGVCA